MAFQLLRELPSGVSGDYWRINYVTVNCNEDPYAQIWLSLYINRQARLDNKASMHTEELRIPLQQIDSTFSYDFRACLYNAIKQLPGWEDAVDVFNLVSDVGPEVVVRTDGYTHRPHKLRQLMAVEGVKKDGHLLSACCGYAVQRPA